MDQDDCDHSHLATFCCGWVCVWKNEKKTTKPWAKTKKYAETIIEPIVETIVEHVKIEHSNDVTRGGDFLKHNDHHGQIAYFLVTENIVIIDSQHQANECV